MEGSSSTTRRRAPVGSARTALVDTGRPRESKDDARPVARAAIDPDRPGMRLDQTLGDGEAPADAARALSGARQTYERLEDPVALARRDARPVVANLETDVAVLARHADPDLRSRGRKFRGVLDKVRQHLLDLDVVELDGRKIVRNRHADRMARGHRTHATGYVLHQRADVVPRLVRNERPVLDPGQIEKIADDPIEAERFVLDRARELVAFPIGPIDVTLSEAPG